MSKATLKRIKDIELKLSAMVCVDVEIVCSKTGKTVKKLDGKGLRGTTVKIKASI